MKENQCQLIMRYMEDFGSISPKEAFEDIGCMRLAARIKDLRDDGVQIDSRTECGKNRWGKKVSWSRYSLAEPEK